MLINTYIFEEVSDGITFAANRRQQEQESVALLILVTGDFTK